MDPIKLILPGESNLLVTAKANELITAVNALLALKGLGCTVTITAGNSTIKVTGAGGIADQVITINNDTPSLVTITGAVVSGLITLNFVWAATEDCAA